MALSPGSAVAGYTVEGVLGQGGMGTVYQVRNPSLPRSDALKVLSAELSADPQFRARFEREAELAATLNHPNIVTVYARGETDGQLWIAMQYVAGSDADQELRAGRMTADRAVHIVAEVAKALDYAHRRHVLHRDIKPANFLLDPDDERVFLADFGIARALDEATHLTQAGTVMASVAYAAPESLTSGPVDGRADVYSLGCSLYRLLTAQAPFSRSGGMAAMAAAHLSAPPPRVTDVVPALPRAIDDVIAHALAKNPAERFQTARELAEAAAHVLGDSTSQIRNAPTSSLTAPWPSGPTPAPPWSPPGHPGARTAPTGPGGMYGVTSGAHFDPRGGPPTGPAPFGGPPPPPSPQPRLTTPWWRRPRWIAALVVIALTIAAVVGGVAFVGGEDAPAYQAQTFVHTRGSTEITEEPKSVAALGPGDAQAVLALGVQPVAVVAAGGVLPSWEQAMVKGDPRIIPAIDTGVIAAARPDLIIDTGQVDVTTYNTLTLIAPTVTRPQGSATWTWQDQLTWIARMLGRSATADQLLDDAAAQQADIRSEHPGFESRTIQVVNVTDDGISVALGDSPAAQYLSGLGFRYSDAFARSSTDTGDTRAVPDPAQLNTAAPDVRVVVRTDAGSGGGSYNGLPNVFAQYRGATVIVDDPRVIAALGGGGFAATEFLNANLVDALGRQVR